ncbi:histone-lysine N-methyltransferase SETMAR-like [Tachypleus tridentatus]|uniref:histone-lysine N-methyltransferase SETMAR-like n=1 Tax=Tachypleus tridentatus TaxID=6853 RepID=UPI003FD26ECC
MWRRNHLRMYSAELIPKVRNRNVSLGDKEGSSCVVENVQFKALVEINLYQTVPEMAQELGVGVSTISDHLEEIGKNETLYKNDPFLDLIVNCDETRIQKQQKVVYAMAQSRQDSKTHPKGLLSKLGRKALINRRGPIFLHDNARSHLAHKTLQKLKELGYETLPHLPYSPDLSSPDYHVFKHLDNIFMTEYSTIEQ